MPLTSMTGFARSEGELNGTRWHWEARSVNGKSLDIRLRMPPGFEQLEADVRAVAGTHLRRGNCQLSLQVTREQAGGQLQINQAALDSVLDAVKDHGRRRSTRSRRAWTVCSRSRVWLNCASSRRTRTPFHRTQCRHLERPRDHPCRPGRCPRRGGWSGCTTWWRSTSTRSRSSPNRRAIVRPENRTRSGRVSRNRSTGFSSSPPASMRSGCIKKRSMIAAKVDVQEELDRLFAHVSAARDLLEKDEAVGTPAGFPDAGVQPRGQHAVLEGERSGSHHHWP